ncbi:MAG: creatininase family protein [Anaerolineales bacterium]|nr:MAG: creatininase family protein [Anaerolineales bacterium]
MLDAYNTSKEIGEAAPEIAIFAIGAIEQHSVHLPLGTDWLGIADLAQRVAAELDAFLATPLPFSMSQCHGPMAGTVWLKPKTLAAVLRDVAHSLFAQGFRKVLVLNGHGGNFVLEAEIRRINLSNPDLILLMPPIFARHPDDPVIWDKGPDVHAEEAETSHQLFINPHNVKSGRVDYLPPVGREFLDYAYMGFISEHGAWGHPSYGTAEKGEKFVAFRVKLIAEWARQTFARVEDLRQARGGEA